MTMSSDLGLISVPTSAGPITTITTVTSSTRSTSSTTTKGGDKDEKSAGSISGENLCLIVLLLGSEFGLMFYWSYGRDKAATKSAKSFTEL